MSSLALPHARAERDHHLRGFVGRRGLVASFVEGRGRGGFTLVVGAPGMGKSALLARLSDALDAPFHFAASHRDPARFVPSLVAQARALAGRALAPDERALLEQQAPDDLRDALTSALDELAGARSRATLVLDALDELDEPTSVLGYLPTRLPPEVGVVLSCRADVSLLATLRARLEPLDVLTLPPLDVDDLNELPGLTSADRAIVLETTGGIPLLAAQALRDAAAGRGLARGTLTSAAQRLFEGLLAEATARGGHLIEPLLGVLAIAREPLTSRETLDVLAALHDATSRQPPPELPDVRAAVAAAGRLLDVLDDGALRPFHTSFSAFITDTVLGRPATQRLHRAFANALARSPSSPLALTHAVHHVAASGDDRAARELAEQGSRMLAQLASGMLPELLADLARVGSPRAEIVRRHAELLVAHPDALASALSFEGITPDAPSGPWLETLRRREPPAVEPSHVLRLGSEVLALAVDASRTSVAIATADGVVRVIDARTATLRFRATLSDRRALALAFSPSGVALACGSDTGAHVLDADTGQARLGPADLASVTAPPEGGPSAPIWGVAWLSDDVLALGARDGHLGACGLDGGLRWRGRAPHPLTALIAPSPRRLVACGARGGVTCFDAERDFTANAPIAISRALASLDRPLWSAAARHDEVVLAAHDGSLSVLQASGEVAVAARTSDELFGVALHPRGDVVAFAGTSGRVHIGRLTREGLTEQRAFGAHQGWVNALAWTDAELWTGGTDGVVRSHRDLGAARAADADEPARPTAVAHAPSGEDVVLGHHDGTLELARGDMLTTRVRLMAFSDTVTAVAASTRLVAAGSRKGDVALFRVAADARALDWIAQLDAHAAEVTALRFLTRGGSQGVLATASRDHEVRLFSVIGRRLVAGVTLDASVVDLEEAPSGDALVARHPSGDATVLDLPTLERRAHAEELGSHGGPTLLSGSSAEGASRGLAAHESAVFSPEGRVLARAPFTFRAAARRPDGASWICLTPRGLLVVALA